MQEAPTTQADASAVSCRFAKRACDHSEQLFRPSYQRVNRSHGVKILRCFPHCCPAHVPRSYCGSSLSLEVDLRSIDADVHRLRVVACFRPQEARSMLRIGEIVQSETFENELQSASVSNPTWIASQLPPLGGGSTTLSFEINAAKRWFYPWQSGKNSVRRTTLHVLEAFVLELSPNGETMRCLGRIASSGFTIVSFRRLSAQEPVIKVEEPTRAVSSAGLRTPPAMLEAEVEPITTPLRTGNSLRASIGVDQDPFYVALGAIFAVAEQYPLRLAQRLLPHWTMSITERSTSPPVIEFQDAEEATVHLVWWLLHDRETHYTWRYYARQGASVLLLDADALIFWFRRWLRWFQDHIESLVASLQLPSVARLARAVSSQRRIDPPAHRFDWRSFVAHARELVTRVAMVSRPLRSLLTASQWYCPLDRVTGAYLGQFQGEEPTLPLGNLPVAVVFAFWQQLSRLHIHLNTHSSPNELIVCSNPSDDWRDRPVTRLLMDNRFRWFNALPHGEPPGEQTLLEAFGDYIATQRRDGTVEITCFSAWSSSYPFRWSWSFKADDLARDRLNVALVVSAGISSARLRNYATREYWAGASIQEKLSSVQSWHEQYTILYPYTRRRESRSNASRTSRNPPSPN